MRRAVIDERYGHLTPAQWACLATLAVGLWLMTRKGEVLPFTEAKAVPAAPDPDPTPLPPAGEAVEEK